MKKHLWKIAAGAVVVAVLVLAFCLGGEPAPDSSAGDSPGTGAAVFPTEAEQMPAPQISQEPESVPTPSELGPAPTQEGPSEMEPTPDSEPTSSGTEAAPPAQSAPPETVPAQEPEGMSCTISITCADAWEHAELLDDDLAELLPADGWILEPMTVKLNEGESVFHILQRTCKQQSIHMEYSNTPIYNTAYIEGLGNLYEFDVGETSGWRFSVNGEYPSVSSSAYSVKDGDEICWVYICDLSEWE